MNASFDGIANPASQSGQDAPPLDANESMAGDALSRLLGERRRFGVWAVVAGRDGRQTKVPFRARGVRASSADGTTWMNRAEAHKLLLSGAFKGLAVYLGDLPDGSVLCGIDLDSCRDPETGFWTKPWAPALLERFASYAEISPSKTGAKVYFLVSAEDRARVLALLGSEGGKQKRGRAWKVSTKEIHPPGIEFYSGGRFFAVTLDRLQRWPDEVRTVSASDIEWLFAVCGPSAMCSSASGGGDTSNGNANRRGESTDKGQREKRAGDLGARALERLHAYAKRRPKLARLLVGDCSDLRTDQSRSARDFALGGYAKDLGLSYHEMRAALILWEHGAGAERHDDVRYFTRIFERVRAESSTPNAGETAEGSQRQQDGRPLIYLRTSDLHVTIESAETHLACAGLGIFQSMHGLVRIVHMPIRVRTGRRENVDGVETDAVETVTAARIVDITPDALPDLMSRAGVFMKFDKRAGEWVPCGAPEGFARNFLGKQGDRPAFRLLRALVSTPTLRPDGTLLDAPGYDEQTGVFFDPGDTSFPKISFEPSRADAEAALRLLSGLLDEFPFESAEHSAANASRAVALSGLLTGVSRGALSSVLIHAFTAREPGSGKSTLADLISMLMNGRRAAVMFAAAGDQKETEARLTGQLLLGAPLISIDNVTDEIGGQLLCGCVTQEIFDLRPLGTSAIRRVANTSMVAVNGNNLRFTSDMDRRVLYCVLDAKMERPIEREFSKDPIAMVAQDRGVYVAACLTILRAYIVAGRPRPRGYRTLNGFQQWSDLVRCALIWLGEADCVATMATVTALDPRREEAVEVFTAWRRVLGDRRVTAGELVAEANRAEDTALKDWLNHNESEADREERRARELEHRESRRALKDALLKIASKGVNIDPQRLGTWLSSQSGRIVGEFTLTRQPLRNGAPTYQLVAAAQSSNRGAM